MEPITTALAQGDLLAALYVVAAYLILGGLGLWVVLAVLVAIANFARWSFNQIRAALTKPAAQSPQ